MPLEKNQFSTELTPDQNRALTNYINILCEATKRIRFELETCLYNNQAIYRVINDLKSLRCSIVLESKTETDILEQLAGISLYLDNLIIKLTQYQTIMSQSQKLCSTESDTYLEQPSHIQSSTVEQKLEDRKFETSFNRAYPKAHLLDSVTYELKFMEYRHNLFMGETLEMEGYG